MMTKRNEGISIAIISEGDTEAWYFNQLSKIERVHIKTYPKEGKKLESLYNKANELLKDKIFDYIFGLIDLDALKGDKSKLKKLENLSDGNSEFYLIQSQPCFEYWFYLHNDKYSSRYFSTWENTDPLKPEVQKIIDKYEKSNKFYRTVSGKGVYSFLRPKLINACSYSLKLFNDKNTQTVCEIFYVVGILFCSKCRDKNCSNEKFYTECINNKHLCENMKKMLKKS
ncbi:MAG: RloB family protein [Candidatus Cloacimonadota bacterium]|nr:RloB family protein [Candidatus Cloacimonadota bacterium]